MHGSQGFLRWKVSSLLHNIFFLCFGYACIGRNLDAMLKFVCEFDKILNAIRCNTLIWKKRFRVRNHKVGILSLIEIMLPSVYELIYCLGLMKEIYEGWLIVRRRNFGSWDGCICKLKCNCIEISRVSLGIGKSFWLEFGLCLLSCQL